MTEIADINREQSMFLKSQVNSVFFKYNKNNFWYELDVLPESWHRYLYRLHIPVRLSFQRYTV